MSSDSPVAQDRGRCWLCVLLAFLLAACTRNIQTAPTNLGTTGSLKWTAPPTSTSVRLNGISIAGTSNAIAVGDNGTVLISSDGGAAWKRRPAGGADDLLAVCFPTPSHGYAVGRQGTILATRNGGKTWLRRRSGVTSDLLAVSFSDPTTGYVSGEDGVVLATSDGGESWSKRPIPSEFGNPYDLILSRVQFFDARQGYVLSRHTQLLLWTSDGGLTFQPRGTGSTTPRAISFLDPRTGYLAGDGGDVLLTDDGARTWTARRCCVQAESLYDISFLTPQRGVAAGTTLRQGSGIEQQRGLLLATEDGGLTWKATRPARAAVFTDATWGTGVVAAAGYSGTIALGRPPERSPRGG